MTDHTDYSLRVLMYLNMTKRLVTLNELSESLAVPRNSLIKVSNKLAKMGYIETSRGRAGGLWINNKSGDLSLRKIVEETEETFNVAECFGKKNCQCYFMQLCPLKKRLDNALKAFLESLDNVTLNQVTPKSHKIAMSRT